MWRFHAKALLLGLPRLAMTHKVPRAGLMLSSASLSVSRLQKVFASVWLLKGQVRPQHGRSGSGLHRNSLQQMPLSGSSLATLKAFSHELQLAASNSVSR